MNLDLSIPARQLRDMAHDFLQRLPYLVIAALVFLASFYLAKALRSAIVRLSRRRKRAQHLGLALGRLAQGGIVLLGLLVALVITVPSFQPGQLVQILGLSSVAIGFAFKDILQNYLAGVLLLLNEPFRIGDQIVIGSYEGTVENIETRATYLRTYDGRRVVIPNGELYVNSITVNTAFEKRRLQYDVGIGYGDDLARAKALILETLRETPGVLDEPAPEALVVDLVGSSVNVRARWWINPPKRADVVATTDCVLEAIKNKLTAHGIDLPFPTRQILFHDQTEEVDGDRGRQREGWPVPKEGEPPRPRPVGAAWPRDNRQPSGEGQTPGRSASKTSHDRQPA